MQNFLFRKNSHSASVVAKALPRPPESPPSPAPVRGSGSVSRIRRTAGGSPHRTDRPQRPRCPKTAARECTKAGVPGCKRPAALAERTPTSRYAPVQADETAGCGDMQKSVGRMGRRGLGKDSTVRRGMQIGHTSQSSCKSVGRGRMLSAASENPPPRPRSSGGRDHAPARLRRRSGEEAKRPTAPYSARGRRQRRRAAKPAQSDVCANLLRGPDKKTSGPIRTPRPARHRAGYDTHPIHGRLRTPGKPAQAATSPAQRASGTETTCRTQRNSSPTTSLSPTSSHAESALTAPRRTPSARSAATNRTTRSVPSAPQPLRLQCHQPCRIQRSQPRRIRRP